MTPPRIKARVARSAAWAALAVPVALLLWYAADLVYVSTGNEADGAVPSDVIIVLGCPTYEGIVHGPTYSACLQARAHHAAALYHKGLAAHIIPTGGLTGPPPSEAAAMAEIMRGDGVPAEAIVPEEQARDTVSNIRYSRDIMRARGWHTAILVTEPHHIKRAALVARDAGLSIALSPVTESFGWNTPDARRQNLMRDAGTLMSYQFNRLFGGPP